MQIGKDRPVEGWTERFIVSWSVVFCFQTHDKDESIGSFALSEHVVRRLYQRARPRLLTGGDVDADFILAEMAHMPVWSSYWQWVALELANRYGVAEFFVVIPGRTGLFFGEFSFATQSVEIRTFVADAQLSDRQLYVKNRMLEASQILQSSPLALGPIVEERGIDLLHVDRLYLSERLGPDVDVLAEVLFATRKEGEVRPLLKSAFREWLNTESRMCPGLAESMEVKGVRSFHTELQRERLKSASV